MRGGYRLQGFDSANGLTGFLFHALLRDGQKNWVGSVVGGTVEY